MCTDDVLYPLLVDLLNEYERNNLRLDAYQKRNDALSELFDQVKNVENRAELLYGEMVGSDGILTSIRDD